MNSITFDHLAIKIMVEYFNKEYPGLPAARQEWEQLQKAFGEDIFAKILHLLINKEFKPQEARTHWFHILEHRENLKKNLGRDLGLPVTVCDYFINIRPTLKNPVMLEAKNLVWKERWALIDELTALYNRQFFNLVLQREIEQAKRLAQHLSLLMIDLDHFKIYNQRHGQKAGDKVLAEVGRILKKTARLVDYVFRYSGEAFAALLPLSDPKKAFTVAQRLQKAVEKHKFPGQDVWPEGRLTITIGLATFPADAPDGVNLIHRAEEALYQGKSIGRNRVIRASVEQRRHPRFPRQFEVLFRPALQPPGNDYHSATIVDIGLGGLLFQATSPQDIGAPIEIIVKEPGMSLFLQANVVRLVKHQESGSYLLGLSFSLGSPHEEMALQKLIGITAVPSSEVLVAGGDQALPE